MTASAVQRYGQLCTCCSCLFQSKKKMAMYRSSLAWPHSIPQGLVLMSPLPRLHHHDIMTIVELFFKLTIVELLHRATTKSFCHILTQTKKKGKIPFPSSYSPSPNYALTIRLQGTADDCSALCYLQITNITRCIVTNGRYMKNNSTIVIMS